MQTDLKVGDRLVAKRSDRYIVVMSKSPLVSYWMEVVKLEGDDLYYDSFIWYQNGDIEPRKTAKKTQLAEVLREIADGHLEVSS